MNGVIVVDKQSGWTSHDIVNAIRRIAKTRKVGHLGTLDPLATGVLPLLLNRATRLAQFFRSSEKCYEATIAFGYSTDTYDVDGEATSPKTEVMLDASQIQLQLAGFLGKQLQRPPLVSAKKVAGVPAYKLARQKVEFELNAVEVEIFSIDLVACGRDEIIIRVHCSAGTYVRSIAHDLGKALGCGAHLKSLRRFSSGGFGFDVAHTLDELVKLSENGRLREALIPAARLLPEFPTETVDTTTIGFIRNGRDFHTSPFRSAGGAKYVKAITEEGELIAIGEAKLPHLYHPVLVL
ncbi:MAG: tRNA pseudouridine(55) synthase TruB [Bryobacteraceae bacterium]